MPTPIEEFNEQGFTIFEGILDDACLEGVRRDCNRLVDCLADKLIQAGKISDPMSELPFENRLIHLYKNYPDDTPRIFRPELHLEGFFHLFAHPRLLEFIESILGSEIRIYPNYSVRPKLPEDPRTEVLWHQDAGYTSEEADVLRMVNVWTPLVPVYEHNGCMQFVPGSHRQGVARHEKAPHYLQIHDDHIKPIEDQAICIEMNPGDVVFFSNLLFHRGIPNRSDHVRWSLDFRYQDATQDTMRTNKGHLLKSKAHPDQSVRDAKHWAELEFR